MGIYSRKTSICSFIKLSWCQLTRRVNLIQALPMIVGIFIAPMLVMPHPVFGASLKHKISSYQLESFELKGTTRVTPEFLASELGIKPGLRLDDEFVMNTRSRLLGWGIFRSVILVMKKGDKPGWARLIIEVDDDSNVLSDWAMGGILGVSVADTKATPFIPSASNVPMNFKLGLVGRNLFSELHRGSALVDFDDSGFIRQARFAYGLPRFTHEATQFDAEIAVVDPRYRYFDSRGFGARGQGLWTQSSRESILGEWFYGMAMYLNHTERFRMPGFPRIVAGPKVGFYRETRLRGFFPQEGSMVTGSVVISPMEFHKSVFELGSAYTLQIASWLLTTLEAQITTVGIHGYSARGELRFDLPFVSSDPAADQAALYFALQGGRDEYEKTRFLGTSALLGMRYHSSGFIADIGLKITHSPEQLKVNSPLAAFSEVGP
jgi:hypothetical protein